jgi:DNA polymerase (family X)
MTARDVAAILHEVHIYLELHGEDEFKSKAYSRASRALETAAVDLEVAAEQGRLASIPGVGKVIAVEIEQILETGTTEELERLREATPPGLMEILRIRGLGPKKVRAIHRELGVDDLAGLEKAARAGEIAPLAGFGVKSQEKILSGLEELKRNSAKLRLNIATIESERILARLEALKGVERAAIVGDVRCGAEEIEALRFLVATTDASAFDREIAGIDDLESITRQNNLVAAIALESTPVVIELCAPDSYWALLHSRSGSDAYCAALGSLLEQRGYLLDDSGLSSGGTSVAIAEEKEIYAHAGLSWIAPELREDIDVLEQAAAGPLPELITLDDIVGVLHVHSTWSDGRNSLEELVEFASGRGWRYLLICDHSKAAFYANGLDERRVARQGEEIDEINSRYDPAEFRMLKGIECDILADGTMDLDDETLLSLDAVVASIHSSFHLPIEEQTERICRALEHPAVTILGHATGRLILKRSGYEIDYDRVIETARANGRSIELNANPMRLDMSWRNVRRAIAAGVPIAINPDAHSLADYDNLRYGVMMGRKAGMQRKDLLNALDAEEFMRFARARRESRS